ncbi:MAG TPA: hypothetical protein VL262_10640 [Vicinamibacterales bacterium]|nr:hypothetical protein [Vicinamibacterales bacterium]
MRSVLALAVALLLAFVAGSAGVAQENTGSRLRGSWAASVGTRPALQGTWTAEVQANAPNRATGAWTLVDSGARIVASGTWSATRTAGRWSGTWSARASSGAARSGTWQADVEGSPSSFADLLRSTVEKQLAGAWRSAGLQGTWALRGR